MTRLVRHDDVYLRWTGFGHGVTVRPVPSDKQLAKRGGAVKVRRIKIGPKKYATVYVVRKKGPRGGRTMLGEIKTRKRGK